MSKAFDPRVVRALGKLLGAQGSGGMYAGSRQFRKKRPTRKRPQRRSKMPRKVKGLTKQVKELKRLAESDMGTHTQRNRDTWNVVSAVNQQQIISIPSSSLTLLEEVISQLRYYDPTAPTTLVTADGTVGTYQKEFYFSKVHSKILVRNNYQVPCSVSVYSCRPKVDTSISPGSAWSGGLVDIGNPGQTNPLVYLTDSVQFNDLWSIERSKRVILEPGQMCAMTTTAKPFQYDPTLADSHNTQYQKMFQAHSWHLHIQGVIGHDTVEDEQGILQAGVDFVVDNTYIVKYPAGADIVYLHTNDESSTFTNGGVISNKPYTDNQSYSQA